MNTLYTASALATGTGRNGHTRSRATGCVDLLLAVPKELGGPAAKTNPEQLFAAGWAACFHSALKRVAGSRRWTSPARRSPRASGSLHGQRPSASP